MDLVKAAKKFRTKCQGLKKEHPLRKVEESKSYDMLTSLFYECFKLYIDNSKEKIDFIESFYEELKSFSGKPVDKKTNEAYCALFDEKVLKNKIPNENSKLINMFRLCQRHLCDQLKDKIKYIEAIENNEETIEGIIDIFNDTAKNLEIELKHKEMYPQGSNFTYRNVMDSFFDKKKEKLSKSKTISDLALKEIGDCMNMFYHNNGSDALEYNDTVNKLNELDKKIMDCECLLDNGGKKIVRSDGYTSFRSVFLRMAKRQSK